MESNSDNESINQQLDESEILSTRLLELEEYDGLSSLPIVFKNNKKRREEYYYRLLKAYQVFDKDCTKNDFAKFLGLKFTEGRNFPLLEKWINDPDIVYDDAEETFSFYEYGSCFLRKKNEINEYPNEINLCGPPSEFNSNDSVSTKILIKNEKNEIKRLKEKGLFNSATFNYIYKPIKAREFMKENKKEIYILVEWPGYKNAPNKWIRLVDFTEPSLLVNYGLLDSEGKIIDQEKQKKEREIFERHDRLNKRNKKKHEEELSKYKRPIATNVYIDNSEVMDNIINTTISEGINKSSTNIKQTNSAQNINTTKNKVRRKRAQERKRLKEALEPKEVFINNAKYFKASTLIFNPDIRLIDTKKNEYIGSSDIVEYKNYKYYIKNTSTILFLNQM